MSGRRDGPPPLKASASSVGNVRTSPMEDFLPQSRRATQHDTVAAGQRVLTMEERLNRMRIEDRRRALNEQARSSSSSTSRRSGLNARAPAFEPYSQSASARAGALYYASSSLLEEDRSKMQQDRALRRKFAGPAPPTSWRAKTIDGDEKEDVEGLAGKARQSKEHRGRALQAISVFFPERVRNHMSSSVPSLTDVCLCRIAHHLSSSVQRPGETDVQRDGVHTMPLHLKERLMALSGRLSMAPVLSDAAIDLLFPDPEQVRRRGDSAVDDRDEDEEDRDELPDSWDTESVNDADAVHSHDPRSCDFVDLSYAQVSTRSIRQLLLGSGIRSDTIRALSLAGWGSRHAAERRRGEYLRASSGLLGAVDKLIGLKYLSLADTELVNSARGGISALNLVPQQVVSEAIAFLKKLSRRTARLQTLDLSFCTWVNGAVIANVGWHSTNLPVRRLTWPNLQHLVLTGCPALLKPEARTYDEGANVQFHESTPFVGAWHAAHHGVARVTQSPFFLSHRPGLGRAVLADGVGAWDSASTRGSLVERQAAALSSHRRAQARQRTTSPFDDADAPATNDFAISHGIASFASMGQQTTSGGTNEELKPRCPVNTARVERHEWERARILDAVRGRWGSAILGTTDDADDNDNDGGAREGVYTIVFF